jgi:2'-5' RNA ligase
MRTFIAIPLTSDLRDKLGGISQYLKKSCPGVKWVAPEKIHLTLKFLGEVKAEEIPALKAALDDVARNHHPLRIELGGLGCFPNLRRPRVIWVGVKSLKEELAQLAREIEEKLDRLGFQPEKRKFTGHLTLGRVKTTSLKLDLNGPFREVEAECLGSLNIDVILLMKSKLTPRGAIYEVISEHRLAPDKNSV